MSIEPIGAVLNLGQSLIERIWPDPEKQAIELRKLKELEQKGDLAELKAHVNLMVAQLKVNEQEAGHDSIFVAGWRPFIGWTGGAALAYQFVVYPLLLWGWALLGNDPAEAPPVLESGALFSIVTAMLGVGGMRSFDKLRGTNTRKVGNLS